MKFRVVISLFVGIYSVSLHASNVRAELGLHSSPPAIRQTNSPVVRAENVNGNMATLAPVESAAPEAKLFRRNQPWTYDEEQLLLKLRQEQEMPWGEMIEYFPGRTWRGIQTKYHDLTGTKQKRLKELRAWTDEENEILLDLRKAGKSWEEIDKVLPGRSVVAIMMHYAYLKKDKKAPKSVSRRFSAEEDKLLLELAEADVPMKERVKYFDNRTASSLYGRLSKIKPTKGQRKIRKNFSAEEDKLLLELAEAGVLPEERVKYFDSRTASSLNSRLSRLIPTNRQGKFSPKENNLLIEALKKGKTLEEIAQSLGRSVRAVRARTKKLEKSNRIDPVPQLVKGRDYTDAEFDLMHEMYRKGMSWEDIATEYFPGRSGASLKVSHHNFRRKKQVGEGDDAD